MPRLRLWLFALRFAVLYGLLVAPWPGFHHVIGAYVQRFGSLTFGRSGREFKDRLAKAPKGEIPPVSHHIVLFRSKGPTDKGYSDAVDTMIVLYNFDAPSTSKAGGSVIGLDTRHLFWLPFAFYLALVGATPMPVRRRAWALLWGFVMANALLAVTLGADLAVRASEISMIFLSPFWKAAAVRLSLLLIVVSGPSTLVYLFLWPLASFRREDLAHFIPGWREWASRSAARVPTRQERRAELRAERKRLHLSETAPKRPAKV